MSFDISILMQYNFNKIEKKWQDYWRDQDTYLVFEDQNKPKYYVLDMFPYPSGSGLHVGHPLGYIASDIYARYMKLKGYNVLHPMGYDSFGLPAEQYAIETGQHPAVTTRKNISRYRKQLDKMGFCFDWSREIRTSNKAYYRWTQWIFKQLFNSYYCNIADKALPISDLIEELARNGNAFVQSPCDEDTPLFTAEEWSSYSEKEQQSLLLKYRLAFLSDTWVNWCEKLGTVLANDEVKDGFSERGGHPVEQKLMRQWFLRITAYAERLLKGLDNLDWSDSIKEIQRNWIGKSKGASVSFSVDGHDAQIEVFTTRPDTIFGVSFMVLAPEHSLVKSITTQAQQAEVELYVQQSALKSERDRQSEVKNISGAFTGAYAIHPFNGEKVAIWIGDYVLASYGTGAVMAVPCGDQRDWDFAQHFGIDIINIFKDIDLSKSANEDKSSIIVNSDFLSGLSSMEAVQKAIEAIEKKGIGRGKTNYRLRDAIFSRQRYWGEPFPVYYKGETPYVLDGDAAIELPQVDKYLPTETGDPPLARAKKEAWTTFTGDRMEYNTMPGWAGSSWYFLRYMDPNNEEEFLSREKSDYWGQVDLYIGGAEHAVGHLLYSRFFTKFLYDFNFIGVHEPFKKLINQGMILGRSSFVYRVKDSNTFVTFEKSQDYETTRIHVDVNMVDNDRLDLVLFKKWRTEFESAKFILNNEGEYVCGYDIEKMSKSKYNIQTPDDLIEKFGADTLRMYEMFLGPLEQFKPWDTKGINGVHNFLRKLWRLVHDDQKFVISLAPPNKEELKSLHKAIKKVTEDIERYSFNTVVSTLMICLNELSALSCNKRDILNKFVIILSPYAPHISEELWSKLGNKNSIFEAEYPLANDIYLKDENVIYPISFNGKMRFTLELETTLVKDDIQEVVLQHPKTIEYLGGSRVKRIIIIPNKIVNIVF